MLSFPLRRQLPQHSFTLCKRPRYWWLMKCSSCYPHSTAYFLERANLASILYAAWVLTIEPWHNKCSYRPLPPPSMTGSQSEQLSRLQLQESPACLQTCSLPNLEPLREHVNTCTAPFSSLRRRISAVSASMSSRWSPNICSSCCLVSTSFRSWISLYKRQEGK